MATLCAEADDVVFEMAIDFCQKTLPRISHLPAFGAMFAYEPLSIICMPKMLHFATTLRRKDNQSSADLERLSDLRHNASVPGVVPLTSPSGSGGRLSDEESVIISFKAAVLTLHAEAVYLQAEFTDASGELASKLEPSIVKSLGFLQLLNVTSSSYGLLTYMLMLGSYLLKPPPRRLLFQKLKAFTSGMPLQWRGVHLLELLWADEETSSRLVGPEALKNIAQKCAVSAYLC